MWHFALFKIVLTQCIWFKSIDCPFGDFSDELGFDLQQEVLILWV